MRRFSSPRRAAGLALIIALVALAGFRQQPDGSTTIVVVRHAEKAAAPADDPPLDSLGVARSQALAATLAGAGVDRVIVTQYQRTRLTAEPLARASGVTPLVVDTRMGGAAHVKAVADSARAARGQTVVVVGHSNTVPLIVRELGGAAQPLTDDDYDDLFVVIIPPTGPPQTIHGRYGARHSSR